MGCFYYRDAPNLREKPLITIFGHKQCTLCDEMEMEIGMRFKEQVVVEKVDITEKENIRFLRLYRYDIPVAFFNGQFLCMHRLNEDLLRRKLELLEVSKN